MVEELDREQLRARLERRGMQVSFCETREEALREAVRGLQPGDTVCWGGSVTLREIGLIDYLKNGGFRALDRLEARDEEERRQIYSACMLADRFFCSANAVTLAGELVNMDGNGNRVSCLMYGPREAVVIVGRNKLVRDVREAVERIRTVASPRNARRGGYQTACFHTGTCADCYAPECICGHLVVTRFNRVRDRIRVILVDEELGF